MDNNDILRRIRYAFDINDSTMMETFALGGVQATRAQISSWLKKDIDPDYLAMPAFQLSAFLNGFIIDKRGKREGPGPIPEKQLTNNMVLRKLKIALNLKDTDILELLELSEFKISKHELSAFFENPDRSSSVNARSDFTQFSERNADEIPRKEKSMKTIGLIGGMSWESSAVYYSLVNKKVKELLGGFHSCKNIMVTVDFAEIEKLQHTGNWETLDRMMAAAAKQLEAAGADIVVLCTNTMHLCTPAILENISIPFLHIAEATGLEIVSKNFKKVALLGTKFTMEKDFYKKYINDNFNVEVIVPNGEDRAEIHRIIYEELVQGEIKNESRETYKQIISKLEKQGAEGVILGCTEIPLLISDSDVNIPIFDTTTIHAEKAVEWALKE